mgnify:CR=1 FL=1
MNKYLKKAENGSGIDHYTRVPDTGAKQKITFTKMHGCANDYVYIDCFQNDIQNYAELAIYLSDRHTGIGGDGVIYICPSDVADARMRMYNLDGSEGMMCGNGIRCVAKYVYDSGIAKKDVLHIETKSGIKICRVHVENGEVTTVTVDMGKAELVPAKIPVDFPGDTAVKEKITVLDKEYEVTCVSMGNPHCVIFQKEDVDDLDLTRIGPKFEHHPLFPERVNTEFVNVLPDGSLKMRVWERGSGETWACGTGSCATGVAACLNGFANKNEDIVVHLRGGDLTIRYTDETVFMTGAATTVFKGEIEI